MILIQLDEFDEFDRITHACLGLYYITQSQKTF